MANKQLVMPEVDGTGKQAQSSQFIDLKTLIVSCSSLRQVSERMLSYLDHLNQNLGKDPDNQGIKNEMNKVIDIVTKCVKAQQEGRSLISFQEDLGITRDEQVYQSMIHDFNTRNSISDPFWAPIYSAKFVYDDLHSFYSPGKRTLYIRDVPVAPEWLIRSNRPWAQDEFSRFPDFFGPSATLRSGAIDLYAWLNGLDDYNFTAQASGLAAEKAQLLSGVLPPWLALNYIKFMQTVAAGVPVYQQGELELLFRSLADYGKFRNNGFLAALYDNNKTGRLSAFIRDQKGNWFDAGVLYQNGEMVSGSRMSGKMSDLFGIFNTALNITKYGDNTIGYAFVQVPSIRTTVAAEQAGDGRSEVFGVHNLSDKVSIQAGWFNLDNSLFYGSPRGGITKGISAGAMLSDFRFKGFLGTDDSIHWNTFGIDGRIMNNTYLSFFTRMENGRSTNSNLEASHVQSLGDGAQLQASFRWRRPGSDRKEDGSGTIEFTKKEIKGIGKDVRIALAYDGITPDNYRILTNDYLRSVSNVTTVEGLLNGTRDYLTSSPYISAMHPRVKLETGTADVGTFGLAMLQNGALEGSYRGTDGQDIWTFSTNKTKDIKPEDLSFSYTKNKKLCVQLNNNVGVIGGQLGDFSFSLAKPFASQGIAFKGLLNFPESESGFGLSTGSLPANESSPGLLAPGTFFIGAVGYRKNVLFNGDRISADIHFYPNKSQTNAYFAGVDYSFLSLGGNSSLGATLNFGWVPNSPLDRGRLKGNPSERDRSFNVAGQVHYRYAFPEETPKTPKTENLPGGLRK